MRALLVLTAVLSGCVSNPPKADPPPVQDSKPVLIDRSLLEQCDKPAPLSGRDEAVFTAWATDLLSKYRKCYEKNDAHIKLLQFNFPQVQPKP